MAVLSDMLHYGESLPGILEENIETRYDASHRSIFAPDRTAPGVSPVIFTALRYYAMATENSWKGCGIGKTKTGMRLAEILTDGTSLNPIQSIVVGIAKEAGTVYGATAQIEIKQFAQIKVGRRYDGAEAIILALMPEILQDTEAASIYAEITPLLLLDPESSSLSDYGDVEGFGQKLATLCDNIYQRMKNDTMRDGLKVNINPSGELRQIKQAAIKAGTYEPEAGSMIGAFYALAKDEGPVKHHHETRPSKLREKYSLGATLTKEEAAAVPVMPDELYSVPERVEEIARLIHGSSNLPCRIRTWAEVGPAGTGKTTDVKLVANILGLGYLKATMNAGSELFDLIGQVFPNDGNALSSKEILKNADLPSFEDIIFDLEGAYKKLEGGDMPKGFTQQDCVDLLIKKTLEYEKSLVASDKDFSFREGPLAVAIQGNYVFEIQEAMTVQQQGVLVGLNSIMEQDGSLELPSGKILRKNENMCIAMTSNGTDYAGNLELQGSVESRNALYYVVPNPPTEVMAKNAMAMSGLKDKDLALAMAKVVERIQAWRDSNGTNCGSCGPRELMFWMACVAVDGPSSVMHHAKTCIINKATHDPDEREELIRDYLEMSSLAECDF